MARIGRNGHFNLLICQRLAKILMLAELAMKSGVHLAAN
jgi:hypothetical protein